MAQEISDKMIDELEILAKLETLHPIFSEIIPLTLQEVFISEMEAAGYDIDNILS